MGAIVLKYKKDHPGGFFSCNGKPTTFLGLRAIFLKPCCYSYVFYSDNLVGGAKEEDRVNKLFGFAFGEYIC